MKVILHSVQISHQIPLLNLENLEPPPKKKLCVVWEVVWWGVVGGKGDGVTLAFV